MGPASEQEIVGGLFSDTTGERELVRWRVSQVTDIIWSEDQIPQMVQPGESDEDFVGRKKRALEQVAAIAGIRDARIGDLADSLDRALRRRCPQFEPSALHARVGRKPQILFELLVPATDADDAVRKARYWIGRASESTRRFRSSGRTHRRPGGALPWGEAKVEAEPV